MTTPAPALLIAGHGTRDDAGAEAFRDLVRELDRRHPELPVAGGFVEPSPPPLGEAVTALVEQGVRRFAAVPLTLVPAGPAQRDIPAALDRERERHPGISYTYGRPLGPHPSLLAVLERRLDDALGGSTRTPGDRAGVTVLLVGRGSTDPDANAEVHRAARLLWEGRGYAGVETAFVSMAAPDVPSGLDRCVKLGARRIVVLPYFLLAGALPNRVKLQSEGWAAARPEVEVVAADVIGPEPELLDVVMERYREAVAGDPRMNSDARAACTACAACAACAACSAGAAGTACASSDDHGHDRDADHPGGIDRESHHHHGRHQDGLPHDGHPHGHQHGPHHGTHSHEN